ncbi:MAG: phosphate acyltransferase PlsX [Actinobacteria bacterium]|nr:MAG: phosphate acyltransferase PlsX [Actinomycetota bacterium]
MPEEVTLVVDAVGGDFAPAAVLDGVTAALAADPALTVLLAGPADVVEPYCAGRDRATAMVCPEVIAMGEHPAQAVRSKRDSSIVAGCRAVKEGRAHAFFSAGNTGACMAAGTLVMGRIAGVSRPAIAAVLPTSPEHRTVLLDVGANADCKPENLLDFAHMGAAYARIVLGSDAPTVGLLNIGSEEAKGSQLALDAHALMREHVEGFVGNVEGGDVPHGTTDVVVTDGFSGNVALKVMEGLSSALLSRIRAAITGDVVSKAAAAVLKPRFAEVKAELDPETVGGAPLLGVDGVLIIGHGGSGPAAVAAACGVAARAVRGGLVPAIARAVANA